LTDSRVILVGHSLGALTCLAAATQIPQRIEAIVLEEPPFPIPTDVRSLEGFWAEFAEAVVGLLLLKHQPTEVIVEQLMERDPELGRAKAEDAANSITTTADGVFASIINGDFNVDCLIHSGLLEHVPALIFQGALPDHRALSDDGVLELRALMPHSRVEVLPETGHSVHQGDPEGFSRSVLAFLKGLPAH
jgi:pimeloyl-ACP methyl ester carboxylesterase